MVTAGHAKHSIFNRPKIFGNSILIIWSLLQTISANAQVSAERVEGLRDNTPRWHAITGARLVLAPGKVIEKGTGMDILCMRGLSIYPAPWVCPRPCAHRPRR
mgnify:CR=1 FL=1